MLDPPTAPEAGAALRAARERVDWPLQDAAATLRIKSAYLQALEEGHLNLLPGNAYVLGFLRTYARALGLDPEMVVAQFKAEAATVTQRPDLAFPAPVPERGLPAGAMVLLGLFLVACVYIGWYRLSGEGRLPAETVTSIPERLTPLAEQAIPPAAPPVVVADVPWSPAPVEPPAPPVPSISPASAAAAPVNPLPVAAPPSAAVDQGRILVRATADAWIQVKDRAGAVLLNRVLKMGETWPVPPRGSLLLTTGNAGGTDLVVDGSATPSLGGAGVVRRDLPLDPDVIKDGKLVAVLPQSVATPRAHQ